MHYARQLGITAAKSKGTSSGHPPLGLEHPIIKHYGSPFPGLRAKKKKRKEKEKEKKKRTVNE